MMKSVFRFFLLFFFFIFSLDCFAFQTSFKWGGRIQADYLFVNEDNLSHRDSEEIRRARLYFSGELLPQWDYKIQYDFAGEGEWKDVYIGYSGFENTYIQVGQIFEMVSLEGYTSSKNLTFIERSLPVAFVPDRALGASITHWNKNWMFAAGYYGRNLRDSSQNTTGSSVRLAWSHQADDSIWHLGASIARRSPTNDSYRVRTRPETHVTDTRLLDTMSINDVDSYTTQGIEFAYVDGPFSLQAEYLQQKLTRTQSPDATLSSWYLYSSYFLTGESRNYSQHYGIFSSVTPQADHGAWEVALRYSNMDLNDATLNGGKMDNWTLGVNWYWSKQLKFVANYIDSQAERGLVIDRPKMLQFRVQYVF